MSDSDAEKRRKAIEQFFALDRMGLVKHDWSEVAQTGLVKVSVDWDAISDHPDDAQS